MNEGFSETKGFIKGLMWGIIIAVGLLIFLETDRGQKLKKRLRDESDDLLDSLPDLIDRIEEKGEELIKEAGKIEKDLREEKADAAQKIAETVEEKLGASLTHIESLQEHGREITSKIKSQFFKNIPRKPRPSVMN